MGKASKKSKKVGDLRETSSASLKTEQIGPGSRTAPRRSIVTAALVAAITFMVFLPALQNEFTNWDDDQYVYDNPFIRSLDANLCKTAFLKFNASNWHPLTWISHALDYAVWGLNPLGHHLMNNILHSLNTFLVVLLVVRLLETAGKFSGVVIPASEARRESFRNAQKDSRPGESPEETGQAGMTENGSMPSPSRGEGYNVSPPLRGGDKGEGVTRFTLIAAATTGLLFGIHPLNVEAVAWVAERKELLCAFFFLLSIMSYLRYAVRIQSPSPQSPPLEGGEGKGAGDRVPLPRRERASERGKYYLLTLLFFILALLSKPMAVSLPFVLLILDWYPFHRIQSLKTLETASVEKLPFIALSLISSLLTILAQKTGEALRSAEYAPVLTRVLVAAKSFIAYLWKMILPRDLTPFYPYPRDISWLSLEYLLPIVLVIGITAICVVIAGKQKLWLAAWGYYVVTILPVIGIVQVGEQAMADRYFYLPGLGPLLIVGLIVAEIYEKGLLLGRPILKITSVVVAIVILTGMSYITIRQISIWKNSVSLWTYVIEKEPGRVPLAHANLGNVYASEGRSDRAMEQYQIAINLKPDFIEAHNNLGALYASNGQLDKAIEEYRTALKLRPNFAEVHNNLGILYKSKGELDRAIEEYQTALRLKPNFAAAHKNLGIVYMKKGMKDEAIREFKAALEISPGLTDVSKALESLNR